MPIPRHRCIAGLCEPDEGIHCLPDMSKPGRTLAEFQQFYPRELELIKLKEESDVTPQLVNKVFPVQDGWKDNHDPEHSTGYLIWMREKETP